MKLMTANEVAQLLNVSVQRVYELIRLHLIPSVRLGRQVRVGEESLRDWIQTGGQGLAGGWQQESNQGGDSATSETDDAVGEDRCRARPRDFAHHVADGPGGFTGIADLNDDHQGLARWC